MVSNSPSFQNVSETNFILDSNIYNMSTYALKILQKKSGL